MGIIEDFSKIKPQKQTLLTIGVFDGVHRGHQHLLMHVKNKAQENGLLSGVITFKSHPETLLNSGSQLPWLDDIDNRINQIQKLGIDIVIVLSFTPEVRDISAVEFVKLLRSSLKMNGLIVGPDFALGKNREGNAEQLNLMGREMGFTFEVMPPLTIDGETVSSSLIRKALAQGNLQKVTKLLGRHFSISGVVVPTDQRGRTLGFPTANLEIKPDLAYPPDGVYATTTHISGDKPLASVTNIGIRPTFESKQRLIETHIIGHAVQIHGQMIKIELIDKMRDEKRFATAEELKIQISKDIEQAKSILKHINSAS